jgi:serine/threonine protein kinase
MDGDVFPERYSYVSLVGRGSCALVYEVEDLLLGERRAFKVGHHTLSRQKRFLSRWRREIVLYSQLVHPCIVPLYDHGSLSDGRPFVVLGLAQGGDMAARLSEGAELEDVLRWVCDTLMALACMHSHGIYHQDIKPDNILVTGTGGGWLADMSVARTRSELRSNPREISGTFGWMSPEQQLQRARSIGPWSDLFSIGRILQKVCSSVQEPGPLEAVAARLTEMDPLRRPRLAWDALQSIEGISMEPGWGRQRVRMVHPPPSDHKLAVHYKAAMERVPELARVPRREFGTRPRRGATPPCSPLSMLYRNPPILWDHALDVLWETAQKVLDGGTSQVALLVGPSGGGKSQTMSLLARSLETGGWMESIGLRYHPGSKRGGCYEELQERLFPWGETRETIDARLRRQLQYLLGLPQSQSGRQAAALTRWCGFLEPGERSLEAALGLVFLYQRLNALSYRGGACLLLRNPNLSTLAGEGLRICESLLSRSVGSRPVLAIASISEEAVERSEALRLRISQMEKNGAVVLPIPRLPPELLSELLGSFYRLPAEIVDAVMVFSDGILMRAVLLVRYWVVRRWLVESLEGNRLSAPIAVAIPESWRVLLRLRVDSALESLERPGELLEALVSAAVLEVVPTVAILRMISTTGLDHALALGLLQQNGRWIEFECDEMRESLLERAPGLLDLKALHLRLAEVIQGFGTLHQDHFDGAVGLHFLSAGHPGKALSPLLVAARQSLESGRFALSAFLSDRSAEAADLCGLSSSRQEARLLRLDALLAMKDRPAAEAQLAELDSLSRHMRSTRARVSLAKARMSCGEEREKHLVRASAVFSQLRDRKGQAEVSLLRAESLLSVGEFGKSCGDFLRALDHAALGSESWRRATAGLLQARMRTYSSDLGPSIEAFLGKAKELGDMKTLAHASHIASLWLIRQRRWSNAEEKLKVSLALSATCGEEHLQGELFSLLGAVGLLQGNLGAGRLWFDAAVDFHRSGRRPAMEGLSHFRRMGSLLMEPSPGAFNEAMDQMLPPKGDSRLLVWWNLLQAAWHAQNGQFGELQVKWQAAREQGLGQLWDLNLCFVLQHIHLRSDSQQIKDCIRRDLQRIYGLLPRPGM